MAWIQGRLRVDFEGYGREIAFDHRQGDPQKPALLWLNGYRSNKSGEKVVHLKAWADANNYEMLAFDNSGLGESGGTFPEGRLGQWLEEAFEVVQMIENTKREVIIAGSSMGGWITLLLVNLLRERNSDITPVGLMLMAPAVDYTENIVMTRLNDEQKNDLATKGVVRLPSIYEADGYPIYAAYLEEAKQHLYFPLKMGVDLPMTIVHGTDDAAIPFSWGEKLYRECGRDDSVLVPVEGGDHRLSKPENLVVMIDALEALIARING